MRHAARLVNPYTSCNSTSVSIQPCRRQSRWATTPRSSPSSCLLWTRSPRRLSSASKQRTRTQTSWRQHRRPPLSSAKRPFSLNPGIGSPWSSRPQPVSFSKSPMASKMHSLRCLCACVCMCACVCACAWVGDNTRTDRMAGKTDTHSHACSCAHTWCHAQSLFPMLVPTFFVLFFSSQGLWVSRSASPLTADRCSETIGNRYHVLLIAADGLADVVDTIARLAALNHLRSGFVSACVCVCLCLCVCVCVCVCTSTVPF